MAPLALKGAVALALALFATGCTYDHMQRTDRVSYRAGNAVRANMAIQTINPSRGSQFVTTGLGASGSVIPAAPAQP
ncbi:MAG: hypothetical protein JWP99_1436 [Devosia sp.]|jgi:hypothetical protein|nr:hypothetical protein [Devosia sp.]